MQMHDAVPTALIVILCFLVLIAACAAWLFNAQKRSFENPYGPIKQFVRAQRAHREGAYAVLVLLLLILGFAVFLAYNLIR